MKKMALVALLCAAGLTVFAQDVPADAPPEYVVYITFDEKGEPRLQKVPKDSVTTQNVQQSRDMNISVQMPASPSIQGQPVQGGAQSAQPSLQMTQTAPQMIQTAPQSSPQAFTQQEGPAPADNRQPAAPQEQAQPAPPGERGYEPYPRSDYKGKTYRIQVGSYTSSVNAQTAYDAVGSAGLCPAFEIYGDNYRVVVPYIPLDKVNEYAAILQAAGFSVWVRDE